VDASPFPAPPATGSASRALPSGALGAEAWSQAHDDHVKLLRDLIRIPSINPPNPPGPELDAANHIAGVLAAAGLAPQVFEPFPGRGSVVARLHGDGTGGEPLLLLSHLDVVPAQPDGWTHPPFAAEVADGYVWGRGAVDMKAMVAYELQVVRLLAARARNTGLDPAIDPIPGLRRDVIFACTADEEAGGLQGARWLVEHHPELLRAAGALNESGAVSVELGGRRFYPIQVAEKGMQVYRIAVRGTWGHGSMPREDNAAVLAAEVVTRLAQPGEPRLTPVMGRFLSGLAAALDDEPARLVHAIAGDDPRRSAVALDALCEPTYARALRALLRDTISPNVIHAGVKYNVIPGDASVEIDVRLLPGTAPDDMREEILARLGDLGPRCEVTRVLDLPPAESPIDSDLYRLLEDTVRAHDPDGVPLPVMAPFATDAKHLALLGVPTYGFAPLRLGPDDRFLELFHGVDERVSLDALRWGLPVLYDVVATYCG